MQAPTQNFFSRLSLFLATVFTFLAAAESADASSIRIYSAEQDAFVSAPYSNSTQSHDLDCLAATDQSIAESFTLYSNADGTVSLQAWRKIGTMPFPSKVLGVGADDILVADFLTPSPQETRFYLEFDWDRMGWTLQSAWNNKYVKANSAGQLKTVSTTNSDRTLFRIVQNGELDFVLDGDFVHLRNNGDGSKKYSFDGSLSVRRPNQTEFFTLPYLVADLVFDADGYLWKIKEASGALPDLPEIAGLDVFDLPGTQTDLVVGFGDPSSFDHRDLPLNDDQQYIYFTQEQSGTPWDLAWGDIGLGDGQSPLLVLDPWTPGVFVHSELESDKSTALEEVGFGVTSGDKIAFTPLHAAPAPGGSAFDGDLYLGGVVSIEPKPGVIFEIDGEAVVDTDIDIHGASFDADALRKVGINGKLGLTFGSEYLGVGPFHLGDASAVIGPAAEWIAFKGEIDPDRDIDLGFITLDASSIQGSANLRGFIDDDLDDDRASWTTLDVAFDMPYTGVELDGTFTASEGGVQFRGTSQFLSTTIDVFGMFSPHDTYFNGSYGNEWSVEVAGTYYSIGYVLAAHFGLDPISLGFSVSAQACAFTSNTCFSVGASGALLANGKIQVCAYFIADTVCTQIG